MNLPTRVNRALRGMGDSSSDNQVSDNDPNDLAGSLSFDSCDSITGACTNAGNVLTNSQVALLQAANIAANTYTATSTPAKAPTATSSNATLWIIGGGLLLAVAFMSGGGRR